MTTHFPAFACSGCGVTIPETHPYSWCAVCGATLPAAIAGHLDNPHTRPQPPQMVTLREDTGPAIDDVHQAVRALLEPPRPTAEALVLTGSMVLFIGASALRGGSPADLVSLVALLFVHESGHYLAMRAFGYRNVRMFFVPFVGAAVSSPTSGVAAWKEGLVLLAGPVPGLVLGAGLLLASSSTATPWLADAARAAFALNLFNLLPLGPLDGGQLFRLTVFARGRWLEAAFQVVTGLALVALALSAGAIGLAVLACAVVATVGHRLRLRKAAERLRADHPEIPRDLAALRLEHQRVLYGYALEAFAEPSTKTADQVAAAMRSLLADLTPPPGWLVTSALLVAWFGAVVAGLVGVAVTSGAGPY